MPKENAKTTKRAAATAAAAKLNPKEKAAKGPKRGLSAYMFFSQDQRNTVKEENPDVSFGQIGKLLGEKWKAMSEAQKKPYIEKAEADKKRYEAEKAAAVKA